MTARFRQSNVTHPLALGGYSCVVTDTFPGRTLAAILPSCRDGFHVKWDIACNLRANFFIVVHYIR
jgi:hypothetical protein